MEQIQLSWWHRACLRLVPRLAFRYWARRAGAQDYKYEGIHELFFETKRIDLVPFRGGSRGFILIIDQKTSLWFHQDGDAFAYDGYEIGEYGSGDVTIFDVYKQKNAT